MAKLGMPDCKWTKAPELGSFIASTIPKEVLISWQSSLLKDINTDFSMPTDLLSR